MTVYALRLVNAQDTAARVRAGDALSLMPAAGTLQARGGVRPGDGAVAVVAGTLDVTVAPLLGWVDGGASDAQGGYVFASDATETLTLSAGDPSQDRVDTVVARVDEDAYDGSGTTGASVMVVEGTPGGGAPALPTSCVPLRDITVPAGASVGTGGLSSGDLGADRRTYTTSLGGVLRVADATERDAAGAADGQIVYLTGTDVPQILVGGSWETLVTDDDTGWVSQGAPSGHFVSDGAGVAVRRRQGMAHLYGAIRRGGTFTFTNDGTYQQLWTLPALYRPTREVSVYLVHRSGNPDPDPRAVIHCRINTAGAVEIANVGNNPLATNDLVTFSVNWPTD